MEDQIPFARVDEATPESGNAPTLSCCRCGYDVKDLEPLEGDPPRVRCPECGLEQRTDGCPKFGMSRWKVFGILVGAWVASGLACAVAPLPAVPAIGSVLVALLLLGRMEVPRGSRLGPIATMGLLWLAANGLMFGLFVLFVYCIIWSGLNGV